MGWRSGDFQHCVEQTHDTLYVRRAVKKDMARGVAAHVRILAFAVGGIVVMISIDVVFVFRIRITATSE